jgi:hypothetical protein
LGLGVLSQSTKNRQARDEPAGLNDLSLHGWGSGFLVDGFWFLVLGSSVLDLCFFDPRSSIFYP